MKTPALQPSNFKAIKVNGELQTRKRMYSKNISDLLSSLEKSGYIAKINNEYFIVDPLLRKAFS